MKKIKQEKREFYLNRGLKISRHKRKRIRKNWSPRFVASLPEKYKNPKFKTIYAPTHLTLKYEDVSKVLSFIKKVSKKGKRGFFINLKLEHVEKIAEGAISMLLSIVSDLEKKNNIYFKGGKPIFEKPRDILERSGFFNHMNGVVSAKNKTTKNKILKTGTNDTHQRSIVPEIHKAMETVWGNLARCPMLFGGIAEMLRNSCDHAFMNEKNIIWHLGISHFEDQNTVKFSFVDNGEGIIKTYNSKGFLKEILSFFSNNAEVLETAFKDGMKSRTGLPWRGKGLPTIFEMYKEGIVTNLVVITNDVYLDFDRNIFEPISVSFSGTYYFWKIDTSCKPHYFPI